MAVIMSKQLVVPEGPVKGVAGSDLEIGSSVFLNVGGTLKEFIIVHQGNPDTSLYDASCDGTWLMMKDLYNTGRWSTDFSGNNDYSASIHHSYLNGDFLALLDDDVQSAIQQAIIPYTVVSGSGGNYTINSGSNGLSAKVFLLTAYEVGITAGTSGLTQYIAIDGACLDYYDGSEDADRIAYLDGTATAWALRAPFTQGTYQAWYVSAAGGTIRYGADSDSYYGIRPALIMPSNAKFNPDTMEFLGVA